MQPSVFQLQKGRSSKIKAQTTNSAHSVSYSVIKSAYINKKRTTVTIEQSGFSLLLDCTGKA